MMHRLSWLSLLILSFIVACSDTSVTRVLSLEEKTKQEKVSSNIYVVNTGGCAHRDSLEIDSVGDHLFIDHKGNLYFRTYEAKSMVPVLISRLYNACDGDSTFDLANYIDIHSFHRLYGSSFYADNRYVYIHNEMTDGGNLGVLVNADAETFETIPNSFYAVDKRSVYFRGMVIEGADNRTFEGIYSITGRDTMCRYGKDKNNFFEGPDICNRSKVEAYLNGK